MTDAADLLAWQLTTTKHTGWVRELRFHPPRRWRIDLAFPAQRLAVEVDGGAWINGRHSRGAGIEADCEKTCQLAIDGWRFLRVTAGQVRMGLALQWIERALSDSGMKSDG